MFGNILGKVVDIASDFVCDPAGTIMDVTAQPLRDAEDLLDGLSVGELREKAALRLGAEIAAGMALSELISWYEDL